jgi:hypothetical protein
MARRSTPMPLTLASPDIDDDHDATNSPLSPKSPKAPRSPFRFTSSSSNNTKNSELSSMQVAADPPQTRTANLPSSQTTPSLSALQQTSAATRNEGRPERETRSGFFANYKASKSSSRLQSQGTGRQVTEDSMSRDTDSAMSGKVSSQDGTRTGMLLLVSSLPF